MSNRSLLEFNHDLSPLGDIAQASWLEKMLTYFRSGNPEYLPKGVRLLHFRHHTDADVIQIIDDLKTALEALQRQALQSTVNTPANEWGQEALAMTQAALAKAKGE